MNIAVIPARGGSKRIPQKNIRPFCGKPMLAYAIGACIKSGLFEHIVVSTDDQEIADVGVRYGVEAPFLRPAALSDDMTPTVPVITHAIRECEKNGWRADFVCCVYPVNPFLHPADMASALEILQNSDADYSLPVSALPTAQGFLRMDAEKHLSPFVPEYAHKRSQDIEPVYFDAGQFYWGAADVWLAGQDIYANCTGLVIPKYRAVDIDTMEDWQLAEKLFAIDRND